MERNSLKEIEKRINKEKRDSYVKRMKLVRKTEARYLMPGIFCVAQPKSASMYINATSQQVARNSCEFTGSVGAFPWHHLNFNFLPQLRHK